MSVGWTVKGVVPLALYKQQNLMLCIFSPKREYKCWPKAPHPTTKVVKADIQIIELCIIFLCMQIMGEIIIYKWWPTRTLRVLDTYAAKTHENWPPCTFPSITLLLDHL